MNGSSALMVMGGIFLVGGVVGRWLMARALARSSEDMSISLRETFARGRGRDIDSIMNLDQRIMYLASPVIAVVGFLLLLAGVVQS